MDSGDVLLLCLIVFVPAAAMWALFIARAGRPGKGRAPSLGIPKALRPGAPDDVLESSRLERVQWGGVVFTAISVLLILFYWLPEAQRQEAFADRFDEDGVHRGSLIFKPPPALPEGVGAVEFKEIEEGVALGMGCANCHGGLGAPDDLSDDATGGIVSFIDPATGEPVKWKAPPLQDVFQRWDEEVIRFTIERGRPGTPMPTWGVAFGGPMTPLMVDDVIAWLKSLPGNQGPPPKLAANASGKEIFEARCAVCHGSAGEGREGGQEWEADTEGGVFRVIYQGMALWGGDVTHLSRDLHLLTIRNGRRYAFMPTFGEAPTQGIPVPRYPLTDAQIEAVMEYERSL